MMKYLTLDRIGPMEGGAFDGQYIEPGVIVDESVFKPESLPLLVESGALQPDDASEDTLPFVVEEGTQDIIEEDEDGTHDSDGN